MGKVKEVRRRKVLRRDKHRIRFRDKGVRTKRNVREAGFLKREALV